MTRLKTGRRAIACAAFFMCASQGVLAADEEVLLRQSTTFDQCPAAIEGMLSSLGAHQGHVSVMRDTGAHYIVKLSAMEANLVFRCNAVTEQIEIARQVPGDLRVSAAD